MSKEVGYRLAERRYMSAAPVKIASTSAVPNALLGPVVGKLVAVACWLAEADGLAELVLLDESLLLLLFESDDEGAGAWVELELSDCDEALPVSDGFALSGEFVLGPVFVSPSPDVFVATCTAPPPSLSCN